MADGGTVTFEQIYSHERTAKVNARRQNDLLVEYLVVQGSGKLRLAQGGLGWKETATGQVSTISAADFTRLTWLRTMRGHGLRIYLKDEEMAEFDGFEEEALAQLQRFTKENYGIEVETVELSVKGWNWGETVIDGGNLEFRVADKMAFDMPLKQVTTATVTAKSEVAIEFAQPESIDKRTDTVVEVRLYVPSQRRGEQEQEDEEGEDEGEGDETEQVEEGEEQGKKATKGKGKKLEEKKNKKDSMMEGEEEEQKDAAQALCEKIKEFSEVNKVTGETIVSIPELPCLVPRGRFEMDMAANYLRLHGKSYDHKILFSSIVKLFLLPKLDETHVMLVLALDPPIRQGQTRYPFLVFQFDKDEEIEVNLENIDDETLRTKYEGKLQRHYDAPTFEVVSTLFRLIAGQKIIVPGTFRSHIDGNSVKCAFKANEGALYPLERNFLFLPKPVTLIPHTEIASVEFSRMGAGLGNPRSFDIRFLLKSGQDISFSNIAKEEFQPLEDFMRQKSIEFHSKDEQVWRKKPKEAVYDDASNEEGSDAEEEKSGRRGKRARATRDNQEAKDDEDESPDEDYEGEESESSVEEEYDEEYESEEE